MVKVPGVFDVYYECVVRSVDECGRYVLGVLHNFWLSVLANQLKILVKVLIHIIQFI